MRDDGKARRRHVSEHHIVRELAAHGAASLYLPLTEVMTRNVITCNSSDTISSVMEKVVSGTRPCTLRRKTIRYTQGSMLGAYSQRER